MNYKQYDPSTKISRIIKALKDYHDHCLNEYVEIPKVTLFQIIQLLSQIESDIKSLKIANHRLDGALSTLEANAMKIINQLTQGEEK